MAFDTAPTALIPGFTSDATTIVLPDAFTGIASGDKDPATGDSRAILRSILDSAYVAIQALPTVDRPKRLTIARGNPTVTAPNTLRQSYTVTFETTYANSALSMAPEA